MQRRSGSLVTLVALSATLAAILWWNRPSQSAMEPPTSPGIIHPVPQLTAAAIQSAAHTLLSALPEAEHPLGEPIASGHAAADTFWVSGPVLDGADGVPLGVYQARLLRDGRAWVLVDLEISYLNN